MITDLRFRHWFECKNGRLIFDEPQLYRTNVSYYEDKRGCIVFYDESECKPITKESRSYYFKVLIGALCKHSDFYGFSPLEVHHEMMQFFNGSWICIEDKWEIWYPSMTDMNAKTWREYIEKVTYFAEQKGIVLTPVNIYQVGKSPNFKEDEL